MALVDAHIHLPECSDPEGQVRSAMARGFQLFSCTVNPSEADLNLKLREQARGAVRAFLGVHPSDVSEVSASDALGRLFESSDGIGEIGLDPKYSDSGPGSLQMKAFVDQLRVAERLGKPVQVHSRGSERACMDVLGTYRLRSVLLHWFEGEETYVREAVSRGYYFSFGPALLYSKRVLRVAEAVPPDRTLTESDGPVRFGALGGAAGSDLIASVVFRLAELRGVSFAEAERTVQEVAESYVGGKVNLT